MGKKRRSRSQKIDRGERDPKLGRETYGALMLLNESFGSLDAALRILRQQKAIELVEVRYYRAMVQELRAASCQSVVEGLSQYEVKRAADMERKRMHFEGKLLNPKRAD